MVNFNWGDQQRLGRAPSAAQTTQPLDWSQQQRLGRAPTPQAPLLKRIGTGAENVATSVGTGVGSGMVDLGNLFTRLITMPSTEFQRHILGQKVKVPTVEGGIASATNLANEALNKVSGKNLPTNLKAQDFVTDLSKTKDPIIANIASTIPSFALTHKLGALSKLGHVAKLALASAMANAGHSATKQESAKNLLEQTDIGALTGAAAGKAFQLAGALPEASAHVLNSAKKYIAGTIIKPLSDKLGKYVTDNINMSNPRGLLFSHYTAAKDAASKWDDVEDAAKNLENVPFDNSLYREHGKNIIRDAYHAEAYNSKGLKGLGKTVSDHFGKGTQFLVPREAGQYEGVKAYSKGGAPLTYFDAIKKKQTLNTMPQDWGRATSKTMEGALHHFAGRIGNALDEQVAKNVVANPVAKNFRDRWMNQRAAYGHLKQFTTNPMTGKSSSTMENQLQGNHLNKYLKANFLPKKDESYERLNKLSELLGGNMNAAKNALKEQAVAPFLKRAFEGHIESADGEKIANYFKKGDTPMAVRALFNPPEQDALGRIHRAQKIAEITKKPKSWLKSAAGRVALGGLGLYIGQKPTEEHETIYGRGAHALIGATTGAMLPTLISKYGAKPLAEYFEDDKNFKKLALKKTKDIPTELGKKGKAAATALTATLLAGQHNR